MEPFPRRRVEYTSGTNSPNLINGVWKLPGKTTMRINRKIIDSVETKNYYTVLGTPDFNKSVNKPAEPGIENKSGSKHINEHEVCKKSEKHKGIGWKQGDLILNLSDHKLTNYEREILELGLKYCPSPKTFNMYETIKDLAAFNRRMRLKEFFLDSQKPDETLIWMKQRKNSTFTPMKNREPNLEIYLNMISKDTSQLLRLPTDNNYDNLSLNHREALKN